MVELNRLWLRKKTKKGPERDFFILKTFHIFVDI